MSTAPAAGGGSRGDVFLSYSREDRGRAEPLIAALEAAGLHVWWDGLLVGGTAFSRTTEDALEQSTAVLVLWSKTSIASHWVRDEATRGRDRACLVPATLDGAEPPLGFRQFQVIDLSHWRGRSDAPELQQVLHAIRTVQGQPQPGPSPPPARARTIQRRHFLMAGGALAALAGAGAVAWRLRGAGTPPVAANGIVVLPFRNLSGSAAQDYFSDGLSAEVRAALTRNQRLRVIAQVSSDALRQRQDDAVQIAQSVGVAYLLDGSVRLAANRVRVAAELIDGATGFSRWAQNFERPIDDVFAVQSEIATAVEQAMDRTVRGVQGGESAAARSGRDPGGTSNVAAFDAYLHGRALYNVSEGEASDRAALAQFDAAIAADPAFAAAHAARSRTLTVIANQYAAAAAAPRLYADALAAAEKAVALAPDFAGARSTLAFTLFQGRLDVKAAREHYELSRELGSGDAPVLGRYALYCALTGRPAEALAAMTRAAADDPLNPLMHRSLGAVHYAARNFADVIPAVRRALALSAKLSGAHAVIGNTLLMLGRPEEARAAYRLESHALLRLTGLAVVERKLGDTAAAEAALRKLVADLGDGALYQQGQVLAQWGDVPGALQRLQRARAAGDSGLIYARTDPFLDSLRQSDPFRELLRGLGFD